MRVHFALFFVSLLYAILFSLAGQIMPQYMHPEGFVMLRILTAFALFQITAAFVGFEKVQWRAHGLEFAICAFFGTFANMVLFFHGLALTHPINGAILMLVTPLFVAIFDHFRIKTWPKWGFILGTLGAAAGSIWLMMGKGAQFDSQTLKGDILVAINALFYSIYLVRVKKLTAVYQPVTVNRITFMFGVLFMAAIGGLFHLSKTNCNVFPQPIVLKIIYILFFTSFLVYLLNAYAVKKAGPTLAGLYIYLQPVLAAIIALILGTDHLTITRLLQIMLIMISVWSATRFSPSSSKH